MINKRLSWKHWISVFMVMLCVCIPSGSVFAQSSVTEKSADGIAANVPGVYYSNDINGYDAFEFISLTRTTDEPTSKWSWDNGSYYVDGSSNSSTLYTNYYFTGVVGKTFSFSAGSSNKVNVDLVHKGTIIQTVVSSWTINAGGSKSHKITASDLDGYSSSDKYYFRFNSNPIGKKYSVSGSFG